MKLKAPLFPKGVEAFFPTDLFINRSDHALFDYRITTIEAVRRSAICLFTILFLTSLFPFFNLGVHLQKMNETKSFLTTNNLCCIIQSQGHTMLQQNQIALI